MNIISYFRDRLRERRAAASLYAAIVEQARAPVFYAEWGVPDTINGRFDAILLHVFVVMTRLQEEEQAERQASRLSQSLFDAMFTDMDRSVRERGVGDLSVPRHMRRMMNAFRGRMAAYRRAFKCTDPERKVTEALKRNLFGTATCPGDQVLADIYRYLNECNVYVKHQGLEALMGGDIRFPEPGLGYGGQKQGQKRAGPASRMAA